jgi:prolyl-tRNA synthetase
MKMSKLVGRRIKETPKDASTVSHKFIIRGGYARLVSAGIYSLLPLGRKITKKIENIIREEMDAVDGQEILMPVVLPKDLWDESGRYETVGDELLRFKDRNNKGMLLAMTHEEAVVHLIRTEVNSYKQLPFMVYQLQRKYRDEARPRAGLIRVREFTMKDGYSFHETQECLDDYYYRVHQAYENIFSRVGLNDTISIKSDSGMMGGAVSHEFMALSESGEDTLFISPDGQYKANREIATASWKFEIEEEKELEKVHTPGTKTIDEVADYLGVESKNTGKAVFYSDENEHLIFVMIRGDFEVNENKVKKFLRIGQLEFASDELIIASGAQPGYASPIGIDRDKVTVLVDRSVAESSNLVVGANEEDYHFKNFNFKRDMVEAEILDLATVRAGDPCPVTGEPLEEKRGIEVGNIFQLGTKYSDAMNCKFLDKNGKAKSMIMGCYGIGIERTMASVIEQSYDDWGPIWPITIAPYHVHLCALNIKKEGVREASDKIYAEFLKAGIEVLYDDRGEKAGFMFNDADLIGIPLRIIISPKTLDENSVELKIRGDKGDKKLLKIDHLKETIQGLISEEFSKYR